MQQQCDSFTTVTLDKCFINITNQESHCIRVRTIFVLKYQWTCPNTWMLHVKSAQYFCTVLGLYILYFYGLFNILVSLWLKSWSVECIIVFQENLPYFWRMFLRLCYTDITKYTNIQRWTGTEIIMGEKCDFPVAPHSVIV